MKRVETRKKIDTEAIFIAWCAEISTLSRSTFEEWIWIEAKKWLSFAFIFFVFFLFLFKFIFFIVFSSVRMGNSMYKFFYISQAYIVFLLIWHFQIHSKLFAPLKTFPSIDWTMHKNVYNFFIIFQYFSAFLRSLFVAKFMLAEHQQRWSTFKNQTIQNLQIHMIT